MRKNDIIETTPASLPAEKIPDDRGLLASVSERKQTNEKAVATIDNRPTPLDISTKSPNVDLGIAIAIPIPPIEENFMKNVEFDFHSSADNTPIFTPKLMSGAMMVMAVIVLGLYGAVLGAQLNIGQAVGFGLGSLFGIGFALKIRDSDRQTRRN